MEMVSDERKALVARKLVLQQGAGELLKKINHAFAIKKGFKSGKKVKPEKLREWTEEREAIVSQMIAIEARLAKMNQPKRFERVFMECAERTLSKELLDQIVRFRGQEGDCKWLKSFCR